MASLNGAIAGIPMNLLLPDSNSAFARADQILANVIPMDPKAAQLAQNANLASYNMGGSQLFGLGIPMAQSVPFAPAAPIPSYPLPMSFEQSQSSVASQEESGDSGSLLQAILQQYQNILPKGGKPVKIKKPKGDDHPKSDHKHHEGNNYQGAKLDGEDFEDKKLRGANFQGASLLKADFEEADLEGANFQGANLAGSDLEDAKLKSANFQGANLSNVEIDEGNLDSANFQGANLSGADLEECTLRSANFQGADLSGANLEEADLKGANLQGANLSGADLSEANLDGANLQGVRYTSKTKFPPGFDPKKHGMCKVD